MFHVLLHQYWNGDDLPKNHCIVIPFCYWGRNIKTESYRAVPCHYHPYKIHVFNKSHWFLTQNDGWQYGTQTRCGQEVCSFQNLKKAPGWLYKRLKHSTHSPQIQIRLVVNLYLEPLRRSGNVIWVRNVALPLTARLWLACPQSGSFFFFFLVYFNVCFQSAVPREKIHITKSGLPFRLLHLGVPKVVIQDKHSKALTSGFLISDLLVRALFKWGKGHGRCAGNLTVWIIKDTASDIVKTVLYNMDSSDLIYNTVKSIGKMLKT